MHSGQPGSARRPIESPRVIAAQGGLESAGRAVPMPSLMQTPNAVREGKGFSSDSAETSCEVAYITLEHDMLLLSHTCKGAAYVFLVLEDLAVQERGSRRLLLTGTSTRRLEFCLLLGDGRFQTLDASGLEFTFEDDEDFHHWSACVASAVSSTDMNEFVM